MGIKREVFYEIGGYSGMDVAEDIDLSIRISKAGYSTFLIPNAYVFHKRRATLSKFFHQSFIHGKSRIELFLKHKDKNALKIVHFFPSIFTLYLFLCIVSPIFINGLLFLFELPLIIYIGLIIIFSFVENRSIKITGLSLIASILQLIGYGLGLMTNFFVRIVFKSNKETIKPDELK
jgi:GT2 family glycosyltransferase